MSFSLRKDRTGGLVPAVDEKKDSPTKPVEPVETKLAPKPQEAAPVVKAPPNVTLQEEPPPPAPVEPAPRATPTPQVHEYTVYYCAECGVMLRYAYKPMRLNHPSNMCVFDYAEFQLPKSVVMDVERYVKG